MEFIILFVKYTLWTGWSKTIAGYDKEVTKWSVCDHHPFSVFSV